MTFFDLTRLLNDKNKVEEFSTILNKANKITMTRHLDVDKENYR